MVSSVSQVQATTGDTNMIELAIRITELLRQCFRFVTELEHKVWSQFELIVFRK